MEPENSSTSFSTAKFSIIYASIANSSNTVFELSGNMGRTSTAVKQISANLGNMRYLMVKQENGAEEAGKAVRNIKVNIDSLNKMI